MEFWGVEVKAGKPFKMELHGKRALHLSKACCLGDVKKDNGSEHIYLFVNVNGKELVLGTLISKKLPQQSFDLVFDKDVELSHNWKNGSVFFYGYTADNYTSVKTSSEDDSESHSSEESSDSSESDEDIPVVAPNGGAATEVKQEKSTEGPKVSARKDSAAGKQKVEIVEPIKDTSSEDDGDSSDDDDDVVTEVKQEKPAEVPKVSGRKGSAAGKQKVKIVEPKKVTSSEDDDEMSEDDSEDDEDNKSASDEDGDSDEDEETPVQVKSSKKRALASASKTAVPDKKAKMITPQKTDGKKSSVHVATPYPSKQAGKTPTNKPNQQTPKTEGSHSCKPCKRTFKSEVALESHNKAKHSGGK